jgi:hypothetical protein
MSFRSFFLLLLLLLPAIMANVKIIVLKS